MANKGSIVKYADIVHDKIIHATKVQKGSVLMCCEHGNNYSAAFAIAFIMKLKNWHFEEAKKFVKDRRRVVRLSHVMKDSLMQYEQILFPPPPENAVKEIIPQKTEKLDDSDSN